MSNNSELKYYYTARGLIRFEIEVWHDQLNKYQVIKGDDQEEVVKKARAKMGQWDEIWSKKKALDDKAKGILEKKLILEENVKAASELTLEAKKELDKINNTLKHTIKVDDTIDWEKLKNYSDYTIPMPKKPNLPIKPTSDIPQEPIKTDQRYIVKLNLLDKIIKSRQHKKILEMQNKFQFDYDEWVKTKEKLTQQHNIELSDWENRVKSIERQYQNDCATWEKDRSDYLQKRDSNNLKIDQIKQRYLDCDAEAILEYCNMVLSNSEYPDYFPQSFDLDYNSNNKILIVDYQLPSLSDIPTLIEVKYVKAKDEYQEKHLSSPQLNKIYDEIVYQITLRSVHELFEADKASAISAIAFNGFVDSIDPATGKRAHSCILSLQTSRNEFSEIDLEHIDAKSCFKKLKGIGSSKLYSMTPVAPIIVMNKDDRRFIDSYEVISTIEDGNNIAAMDWEDFEHLIRELFEKEFANEGAEVKVTRASRDGGIDAVIFDPHPIRGGKFVIQAKRYTNTVGVSAVRDLFGSVINEGANKGILVSTADYGPDAYDFAKDKPLVLIDGSNLLYLLEKHGQKAKIDLKEAKKILSERKVELSGF